MGFRIRTLEELTQMMIDYTRATTTRITDFRVGSKIRTIYEAVAMVMEQYYHRTWNALREAIEESVYRAFGFDRLPPTEATGEVVFGRSTPAPGTISIPAKTTVRAGDMFFETLVPASIPVGGFMTTVPVRATVVGTIGNVAVHTVINFVSKPAGVETVTNPTSFTTGRDEETPDERRVRFRDYVRTRARGTKLSLEYGAKMAGAKDVVVVESPTITCYTADGEDMTYRFNNPFDEAVQLGTTTLLGASEKFSYLYLQFGMPVTGPDTGTWEYFAESAEWQPLTLTADHTNQMRKNGAIVFALPPDWVFATMHNQARFWVRYQRNAEADALVVGHGFASPPPGFVDVYVNSPAGDPTPEFLQSVAEGLDEYRAHAVTVNVKPVLYKYVDMHIRVSLNQEYDQNRVTSAIETAVREYFRQLIMGEHLFLTEVLREIEAVERGRAILYVQVVAPITTVYASSWELLKVGTITVEVL